MPSHLIKSVSLSFSLFQVRTKSILLVTLSYNTLCLIDTGTPGKNRVPTIHPACLHTFDSRTYRGEFLDEVMGHVHQILIFLHVLLEASALLLLQQVKIISSIQQCLYEAFPGAERRHLGGHGRADPCADHQHQLRGSLGLQTGQQFPVGQAEIEWWRFPKPSDGMEVSSSLRSQSRHWYFISSRGEGADIRNR